MKKVNIQVFGSGCPNCKALHSKVVEVSSKIDKELEVEYITDITKMVELGVMSAPVFAIDGQVITAGKVPDKKEIKEAILEKLKE